MLDAQVPYADALLKTFFLPQNINSAGSATVNNWWFGTGPVTTPSAGLGRRLRSSWFLEPQNRYGDQLMLTRALPQNRLSAGPPVMNDWWFGATTAFTGAAFSAAAGDLGVSVSIPLVGAAITAVAGALVPFGVSSIGSVGYIPTPGPGVGPFANLQFIPQLPGYAFGVTLPLT
jgi:hypothetical protein